jgi:hypothetical protein
MKHFKLASIAVVLLLSTNVNADLISHSGYTLDTDTNVITDGNLEWLRWDITTGMSINQALSVYSTDGWRLASNTVMANLFNSFSFNSIVFDTDETTSQYGGTPADNTTENSPANQFIELFGYTSYSSGTVNDCCGGTYYYDPNDPATQANALFGEDANTNGLFNNGWVRDDFTLDGRTEPGWVGLGGEYAYLTADYISSTTGVALVRGETISAVPIPAAAWLFGSGLIGLIGIARRKRCL